MRKPFLGTTFFALFGLMLLSSIGAFAQTKSVATQVSATPVVASPFNIMVSAAHSRSLYDYQDGTKQESNDFEFMPSYKWMGQTTALYWTYSQDTLRPESSDIGDFYLIHKFKPVNFSSVRLTPSMTAVLPQSKKSRELLNLETALSGKLELAIQEKLLIPGYYFKVAGSVNRNFNRYNTALNGAVNSQYSFRKSILTGYSFGIFSVDTEFHHINIWSYAGSQSDAFEHTEEFSVEAGKHYGFTLGHTNSGSMLKANARDSNLQLVNDNSSLVYAKVSMQY